MSVVLLCIDDRDHFMRQLNSQMTCPGIFFNFIRKDGFDFNRFLHFGFDNNAFAFSTETLILLWLLQIADGSGDAPDRESGVRSQESVSGSFYLVDVSHVRCIRATDSRLPTILDTASSTCTPLLLPINSCHSSTAIIFND